MRGKTRQWYAKDRLKHREHGVIEKSHLRVGDTKGGFNVLRQDGKDIAIDAVEDVDDDQNGQHIVSI